MKTSKLVWIIASLAGIATAILLMWTSGTFSEREFEPVIDEDDKEKEDPYSFKMQRSYRATFTVMHDNFSSTQSTYKLNPHNSRLA